MPRDINGNYTLPAGNPVVPGQVIAATWANPTMEDIANEITNSLSRDGEGGMLVPFQNVDGTLANPGITWTNEIKTGFYRAGTNDQRAAVNSIDIQRWTDTGAQLWNTVDLIWEDIITSGDTGVFLPIAGGTMLGDITLSNGLSANTTAQRVDDSNVGKPLVNKGVDLDTIQLNSFQTMASSAPNTPAGNGGNLIAAFGGANQNIGVQYFLDNATGDYYFRQMMTGAWQSWRSVFASDTRTSAEANQIITNAEQSNVGKDNSGSDVADFDDLAINGWFRGNAATLNTPLPGTDEWLVINSVRNTGDQIVQIASKTSEDGLYHRRLFGLTWSPWSMIFSSASRTSTTANNILDNASYGGIGNADAVQVDDCDLFIRAGFYYCDNTALNIPVALGGTLTVSAGIDGDRCTQIYSTITATVNDHAVYYRCQSGGGVWQPWLLLASAGGSFLPLEGGTLTNSGDILSIRQSIVDTSAFVSFKDETGTRLGFVGKGSSTGTNISLATDIGDVIVQSPTAVRLVGPRINISNIAYIDTATNGNGLIVTAAGDILSDPNVNRPAVRLRNSNSESVMYMGTDSIETNLNLLENFTRDLAINGNSVTINSFVAIVNDGAETARIKSTGSPTLAFEYAGNWVQSIGLDSAGTFYISPTANLADVQHEFTATGQAKHSIVSLENVDFNSASAVAYGVFGTPVVRVKGTDDALYNWHTIQQNSVGTDVGGLLFKGDAGNAFIFTGGTFDDYAQFDGGQVTASAPAPTQDKHLTRKDYVDGVLLAKIQELEAKLALAGVAGF